MLGDPLDGRWLQGVGNQLFGGISPADQIDALSAKFLDNVLDVEATYSHANADAIQTRVPTVQGELAAITGLACDGLDLDASRSDLGDLAREEASHYVGIIWHGAPPP
jgi:hypothetical protein